MAKRKKISGAILIATIAISLLVGLVGGAAGGVFAANETYVIITKYPRLSRGSRKSFLKVLQCARWHKRIRIRSFKEKKKTLEALRLQGFSCWCARRDLNPHARNEH